MADQVLDLRKYNINTEKDVIDFLELIEARLPQIIRIIKAGRTEKASLLSRAEFAEGKQQEEAQTPQNERSLSDRLAGVPEQRKAAPASIVEASRLGQLRKVQADDKPVDVSDTMTKGDPLNLDEAPKAGEVGQLSNSGTIANLEENEIEKHGHTADGNGNEVQEMSPERKAEIDAEVAAQNKAATENLANGPVDLAALAQAQAEKEVAEGEGQSPSEHTSDNGDKPADETQGAGEGATTTEGAGIPSAGYPDPTAPGNLNLDQNKAA